LADDDAGDPPGAWTVVEERLPDGRRILYFSSAPVVEEAGKGAAEDG
jgi:hypothetical protein